MLGATPSTTPRAKLTAFSFNVESRAQAQAIQRFLWCQWPTVLRQTATHGQLCTETVEPDFENASGVDRTLFQRSSYEYDGFGNRSKSTATFCDAAGTLNTRASATTYLTGKYPTTTSKFFIGDNTRNLTDSREYGDTRCRMPTKVTDANGNLATMEYDGLCQKCRSPPMPRKTAVLRVACWLRDDLGFRAVCGA